MKILKHGNPERLKEVMVFTCEYCGCKFEADNTEYEVSHDIYHNDKYYEIKCPECGSSVHNAKEKEYKEENPNPNDNFYPVYGVTPTTITNTELQLDGKFLDAWHEGVMTALHEHIPDSMIKKLDESYKKSEIINGGKNDSN